MKPLLSRSILKQNFRSNWLLWLVLTAILALNMFSMPMIDLPEDIAGVTFMQLFVNVIFEGVGMILMLVWVIIVGNKLVCAEVDRGTMSFTLNTPITRSQLILSKALFFILSTTSIIVIGTAFASMSVAIFDANVDLGRLWLLAFTFILFIMATAGITFFASCWFNRTSYSLSVGAGLPLMFYVLSTLANLENFGFLRFLSLNTLFPADYIAMGEPLSNFVGQLVALSVIALGLFAGGIYKFTHKDLPL